MLPAILAVTALFALVFIGRYGGAYRRELMERWPALLFAGAALVALTRGALWPAIALAALAALAWVVWPDLAPRRRAQAPSSAPEDPADAEARRVLGVTRLATASDIRAAYRTKMARAHPDRGGSHAEAARLTAARDRLLRKRS
jgi:hypothetical protein